MERIRQEGMALHEPTFKDAQEAFREALRIGRLSDDPTNPYFAGNYVYVGTWGGKDSFKHTITRQYIS